MDKIENRKKVLILFLLAEITSALTTLNVQVMISSNLMKSQEAFRYKILLAVNEENMASRKFNVCFCITCY